MIASTQPILGGPHIATSSLFLWLQRYSHGLSTIAMITIAETYSVYGELTSVGNLLPFAQAAKETTYFTTNRWTHSYNPAGLGATNDGAWGGHFRNPAEGIVAQFAHLLVYAVPDTDTHVLIDSLKNLDPRRSQVKAQHTAGHCPRWIDLNGRWAVPGHDYGETIIQRANILVREHAQTLVYCVPLTKAPT